MTSTDAIHFTPGAQVMFRDERTGGWQYGTLVRVKAVNAKGMEGWDWARAVVK